MLRVNSSNVVSKIVSDESNLDKLLKTGLFDDKISNIKELDEFINSIERKNEITVLSKVGVSTGFVHRCNSEDAAVEELLSRVRQNFAHQEMMKSVASSLKGLSDQFGSLMTSLNDINNKDEGTDQENTKGKEERTEVMVEQKDMKGNEDKNIAVERLNKSPEEIMDLLKKLVSNANTIKGPIFTYLLLRTSDNNILFNFQLIGLEIKAVKVGWRKYEVNMTPRIYHFTTYGMKDLRLLHSR